MFLGNIARFEASFICLCWQTCVSDKTYRC